MSIFGNKQNKCILCNRNIGSFYHATAEERFLCDKCATECGYENAFFSVNDSHTLTLSRIQKDHDDFAEKVEENKKAYKELDTKKRFEKQLCIDSEKLRFYSHNNLMCGTKTPIVYLYKEVYYIEYSVYHGDDKTIYKNSEGTDIPVESTEGLNLPVADSVEIVIRTNNKYNPIIKIELLDEPVRKSERAFQKAIETADEIFELFSNIIGNNK